ncbi:hypothetical protein ABH926_000911 [Catenulispora sp. GP43]|uniref:DUF2690 domain-containing protein n=1 Tax=Catenulispora sp. GP43 TaxID=3156263 RepID=UPI00351202EC
MKTKTLAYTGTLAAVSCAALAVLAGPASAAVPTMASPAAPSIATAAPARADSCDNGDPSGNTDAVTVRTATAGSATVELRYSPGIQCAWGRVFGKAGTSVWVDRSTDGGSTWQGRLGLATITSGTDAHTTEFDDHGVLVRACADAGNGDIHCTGWY